MTSLDATTAQKAARFIMSAVRARHPNIADSAHELFEEQVATWDVAETWEGDGALIVLTSPVDARWGAPEAHLHVLTDGSSDSLAWFAGLHEPLLAELPASVSCRLSFGRLALLEPLRALGLGVSKLGLGGDVALMHASLESLHVVDPDELGLRLATVSTLDHVRASSALRRDYFLAHPEHGWASTTLTEADQRAIDERVEAEFHQRLETSIGSDFVLLDGDEVVASFGFTRPTHSPIVGCNASFNICIGPGWQGRGLGTYAYSVMITRAAELRVDYMHGSTSNPGVIAIAAKLGRHLDNWLLRRDEPWLDDGLAMQETLLRPTEYGGPRSS